MGRKMLKFAAIGIVVVLLGIQLRSYKSEYSVYLSIVGCILIFGCSLDKLKAVVAMIQKIESYLPIPGSYMGILVKILGITYLSEFSSDLCKDAGYTAISNQIQLVGKITILAISMPVMLTLFDFIGEFLKP